jgi:hypothetical protein
MELRPSVYCYQQRERRTSEPDAARGWTSSAVEPCATTTPVPVLRMRRLPHHRLYVRMRPADGLVSIQGSAITTALCGSSGAVPTAGGCKVHGTGLFARRSDGRGRDRAEEARQAEYKSHWHPSPAYTSLTHDLLPFSVSSHQPLHLEHRRMGCAPCDNVPFAWPALHPARPCRIAFTAMELINDVRRLPHCDALPLPATCAPRPALPAAAQ